MLPPKAVSRRSGVALKKRLGTGVRLASHAEVLIVDLATEPVISIL